MELEIRDLIKNNAKKIFNQKDYLCIWTFLDCYKYSNIMEIIDSEIKSEYQNCKPELMTDKYCNLLELKELVSRYDIDQWQMENYYLEKANNDFDNSFFYE